MKKNHSKINVQNNGHLLDGVDGVNFYLKIGFPK